MSDFIRARSDLARHARHLMRTDVSSYTELLVEVLQLDDFDRCVMQFDGRSTAQLHVFARMLDDIQDLEDEIQVERLPVFE